MAGTVLLACTLGCDKILALQSDIVGNRVPSVALCYPQGPKGPVRAGPYKLWGDAATRVEYADPDDEEKVVTHVIQLGVEPKVLVTHDEFVKHLAADVGVPVQNVSAEDVFKDFGIPLDWVCDQNPGGD